MYTFAIESDFKKITRHKQVIEWKQTFYFLKSNLLLEQIDFFLIRTLNEGIILVSEITIIVINNNVVRWICYLTLGSNFLISSFCSLCSSYSKFLELNLLTTTTHFFNSSPKLVCLPHLLESIPLSQPQSLPLNHILLFFISTTNAIIQFSVFFFNASGFFHCQLPHFTSSFDFARKIYCLHVPCAIFFEY